MIDYRFYRMHENGKIIDRIEVSAIDDEAAIAEAIRRDHAPCIEIWDGVRLVDRVASGGRKSQSG